MPSKSGSSSKSLSRKDRLAETRTPVASLLPTYSEHGHSSQCESVQPPPEYTVALDDVPPETPNLIEAARSDIPISTSTQSPSSRPRRSRQPRPTRSSRTSCLFHLRNKEDQPCLTLEVFSSSNAKGHPVVHFGEEIRGCVRLSQDKIRKDLRSLKLTV
jgi:hypothetical protein